jgi:TRAP-type C4-dicarboxylate transport system permease small subunit
MRRFLDGLYVGAGYLAGLNIVALTGVVIAQIVGRFLHFIVPSVAQMSGYFMCGTIFLALAHTLGEGEHIRVELLLNRLPARLRLRAEGVLLFVAICITGYFAFYVTHLAWESYITGDRSDGLVGIPYAIPQGAMAAGLILFCIRLIDEFVRLFTGCPAYIEANERKALDRIHD